MPRFMDGVVTIAQESRFQLTDDGGVAHLFTLHHLCGTEPAQLGALQRGQTRVRVRYEAAPNTIGNVAYALTRPA